VQQIEVAETLHPLPLALTVLQRYKALTRQTYLNNVILEKQEVLFQNWRRAEDYLAIA